MRILFLTHSFNSLAQRLYVELTQDGHDVSVEFDINDGVTKEAVDLYEPDLIIAPFLKRAIPQSIWRNKVCLIVHPGIPGDKGPSSIDWAINNCEEVWGVTVLQANEEMDAGPVWAFETFPMRAGTKSSLYRNEVTNAAVQAVRRAVAIAQEEAQPPKDFQPIETIGIARPFMRQDTRAIDWTRDDADTICKKIRMSDGMPGVRDKIFGKEVYLYDVHPAEGFSGAPGEIVAYSGPAICRAAKNGALWIGHVKDCSGEHRLKLPATTVFAEEISGLDEVPVDSKKGYREIFYEEANGVGFLHFSFYNGAMGTKQCERLLIAYQEAIARPTKAVVLMGGPDFWSNGMNLNLIEAASSAADESWRNINAIDDLAEAILRTESHVTIAALQGNAGAGGVFLARAADKVWLRDGIILNPHYKDMGNLYGSEYWTYSLPRYSGEENAKRLTEARLPIGCNEAQKLGLADAYFGETREEFLQEVRARATSLVAADDFECLINNKRQQRALDEAKKPLAQYREEELAHMRLNFYGFDPSYHIARYNFVHKVPKSRTPVTIARHRDSHAMRQWRSAS